MAERSGREIISRILVRTLAFCVLLSVAVYLVDYVVLRVRVATNANAFGTATVQPVYAVPKKNHSTEFMLDDPHDETCVHSLLPHLGHSTCWYLAKYPNRRIDM